MPKEPHEIEPIEASFEDVVDKVVGIKDLTQEELDALPFAKWRGKIDLGGNELDCYVLNDETRVLSSGSTTKAIAKIERGSLQDYIGQKALNPFIDKDKILQETIRFTIPGTQWAAIGITTEHFELICRGYVQALYEGANLTERQREIAIRCAMLTAGLTRIGLDALVDEATGYQYDRAEDALQVKLRAFISEELRAWEKTFPDQLWEEFGRLTGWKTPLQTRPKWWGKLVTELIYDTLDEDVAKYLKENKPPPGVRWHQQLTDNVGVRQLVSRCYEVVGMAKTCDDIHELRQRVARHYGKKAVQLTMFLKAPKGE
ncbi:P63C domain-containing protein [Siccirubricoccus sp. G192]|uniref:P63C domain-containing protein n=1 Tax=Siccirubricoccus sp. G192 TaxID=2849651 RepID=UPI001C2CAC07|nr:P63C domain-containing protein [Siccirubricoccus sp. G192]MBV1796745.1 P63C domain-containing protein [Siccirubricoccus sp. G192]